MDKLKILLESLKTPVSNVQLTTPTSQTAEQNKARARELLLRMQIQLAKSTPVRKNS